MRREELWKLSVLQGQEHKTAAIARLEAVPAINPIVDPESIGNVYKSYLFECPSC